MPKVKLTSKSEPSALGRLPQKYVFTVIPKKTIAQIRREQEKSHRRGVVHQIPAHERRLGPLIPSRYRFAKHLRRMETACRLADTFALHLDPDCIVWAKAAIAALQKSMNL